MKCGIKNRSLLAGIMILSFLTFIALFAAWLSPHDPEAINLDLRLTPPNSEYPFGTDHLGRCVLSRVLFASRISLLIGISVVTLSLFAGIVIGTTAGYIGGLADEVLMRFVDGVLAFPSMFLALAIVGLFGGGLANMVLALVLIEWTGYARVVRASVLTVKSREFVTAAKGFGGSDLYVIVRHVLPHASSPLLVMGTLGMGYVILASAGLSFLGFGVQTLPEWGAMLNEGRYFLRTAPYLMIFPGISIMLTVLGFNFLGDGLRDLLDPKSKQKKDSL